VRTEDRGAAKGERDCEMLADVRFSRVNELTEIRRVHPEKQARRRAVGRGGPAARDQVEAGGAVGRRGCGGGRWWRRAGAGWRRGARGGGRARQGAGGGAGVGWRRGARGEVVQARGAGEVVAAGARSEVVEAGSLGRTRAVSTGKRIQSCGVREI
jgi:hypothetical protein